MPEQNNAIKETGCCSIFDLDRWNEKEHHWEDRIFLRRPVRAIFHMPINFGRVITGVWKKLETVNGQPENPIVLSEEKSMWGSDIMIETAKNIPGEDMVHLSGAFVSKVFEGPYKDLKKWLGEMGHYMEGRGQDIEKMYFWYTTCPKCAKTYGKNYVVIFAKIA